MTDSETPAAVGRRLAAMQYPKPETTAAWGYADMIEQGVHVLGRDDDAG